MEQLPRQLEGDEGLSRPGRQIQQDALPALRHRVQHRLHGIDLIVARGLAPALVFEWHRREPVAPGVLLGESRVPQLLRRRPGLDRPLLAGRHVDPVLARPVGREGPARVQLAGIDLGLPQPGGDPLALRLGLHRRQLSPAIAQHIVRRRRLAPLPGTQDAPRTDDLAVNLAVPDHAPTGRLQGGIDQLGAGLGLVHAARGSRVSSPEKARARRDCLSSARRVSLR